MDAPAEYPLLDGTKRHELDDFDLTHNPRVVGSIPTRPTRRVIPTPGRPEICPQEWARVPCGYG